MTTTTALAQYETDLRSVARRSENTVRAYLCDLRLVSGRVNDLLGASHAELGRAVGSLADSGYAAARQIRVVAALRSFYGFSVRMGVREDDPSEALPRPSVARRLPVVTDGSGVRRLIDAAARETRFYSQRDQAIVIALAGCGLRRHEVAALDVEDVDVERATVRVRSGKGQREREVPVVDGLAILAAHAAAMGSGPLFVGHRGSRMTGSGVWRVVRRLAEDAGLEDITPHTLRRTYATGLHEGGQDIYAISAALGHSSIETTRRYVRANPRKVIVETNLYGLESEHV